MADQQSTEKKFWQTETAKNVIWVLAIIAIYFIARDYMQGEVVKGPAPIFNAVSITGKPVQLEAYKGKPVLVHFWATWCPVCEYERDGIEEVAKDYDVINIASQSGSTRELLEYAQKHGMNADIIINDNDGRLMKLYKAHATPTSFIIDKEGQIQFVEVGYSTSVGLKTRLWSLK